MRSIKGSPKSLRSIRGSPKSLRSIRGSPTRSIRDSPTRSIRGSPTKASDEESEWSSHRFSGSSSPLSAAEELHERSNEKVVDVEKLSVDQLERGKVVDEQGNVESCEYVENDNEEEDLEEEDGEEFTVMGRHGALISLVWGASALYVLLIRAKVQLLSDRLNMILPGGFVRGLFVTRRTGSVASSLLCSPPHPPSSSPGSHSSRRSLCTP